MSAKAVYRYCGKHSDFDKSAEFENYMQAVDWALKQIVTKMDEVLILEDGQPTRMVMYKLIPTTLSEEAPGAIQICKLDPQSDLSVFEDAIQQS